MKNKLLKRANGGFSLVELIVVIAIMAILVGVAVPVYSSYIEKTQIAKDEQMIDEIKHAIEIAGAANTFAEGESGMVVLSTNGVTKVEGDNLVSLLTQTFGSDYANKLALSYSGWGNSGLLSNLTPELALGVANSNFLTGSRADNLLTDVETMTGVAQQLVSTMGGDAIGTSFSELFTNDDGVCALDETAAKYGISKGDYATWEDWGNAAGNAEAFSNLLVLAAADESEKAMNTVLDDDPDNNYAMSQASSIITEFSAYYAYAATNPAFSAQLDTAFEDLKTKQTAGECAAWYTSLKNTAEGYDDYQNYVDNYEETDKIAFMSIMAGLGNPTKEQAENIKNDISNTNLFTEGVVNDMYNSYLGAVDSMSGLVSADPDADNAWTVNLSDGQVAILFVVKNGMITITDTLPAA